MAKMQTDWKFKKKVQLSFFKSSYCQQCWELLSPFARSWKFDWFPTYCPTIPNNMQQGVQTDAACNIQKCCVRLHVAQLKLCLCLRKRCLPENRTHCLNYKSSLRYKRTALYSHEHLWGSLISQTWKFSNWIVLASNTSFIPPRTYLSSIVWGLTVLHYRMISTENPIETEIKKQNHKIMILKNQAFQSKEMFIYLCEPAVA